MNDFLEKVPSKDNLDASFPIPADTTQNGRVTKAAAIAAAGAFAVGGAGYEATQASAAPTNQNTPATHVQPSSEQSDFLKTSRVSAAKLLKIRDGRERHLASASRGNTATNVPLPPGYEKLHRAGNELETKLMAEIREYKHPAKIVNYAIEFNGPTMVYESPVNDKSKRLTVRAPDGTSILDIYKQGQDKNGQTLVAEGGLLTRVDGKLWLAVNWTGDAAIILNGQTSDPDLTCWIPLGETKYTFWWGKNVGLPPLINYKAEQIPTSVGRDSETMDGPPTAGIRYIGTRAFPDVMAAELRPSQGTQQYLEGLGLTQLSSSQATQIFNGVK